MGIWARYLKYDLWTLGLKCRFWVPLWNHSAGVRPRCLPFKSWVTPLLLTPGAHCRFFVDFSLRPQGFTEVFQRSPVSRQFRKQPFPYLEAVLAGRGCECHPLPLTSYSEQVQGLRADLAHRSGLEHKRLNFRVVLAPWSLSWHSRMQ